jgi:hypothetical protein
VWAAYEESGGWVSVEEEVEFGSKGRISTGEKRNGNSARFGRATKKWLGINNEPITFSLTTYEGRANCRDLSKSKLTFARV